VPEHSPTPWEAVPQPNGTYVIKQPSTHHRLGGNMVGTRCGKVVAMNVRQENLPLLLAAPKLLAACKQMRQALTDDAADHNAHWEDWGYSDQVDAAIAKAEPKE